MRTVKQTVADVTSGRLSAEESTRESLKAIAELDGELQAFLCTCDEYALERAKVVDKQLAAGDGRDLPLAGVPVAVKDNLCTEFGKTTCGSKILANFEPPYSAHVVERLERAGAIIVGKTNLDEFAMGSSTENSAYAVTRNPYDTKRVPGGSSGGSAVAVAAGMVPAAIGSDTGGSIRQPASFCGLVGLKPTYGRVSRYGLVAYGSSLDQIGPLTRTAEDNAMMLSAIAGHDPRDSTSVNKRDIDYAALIGRPLEGTKLGIAKEYFGEGLDDEVRRAVDEAVAQLGGNGIETVEIELPHMKYGIACYYLIATAEASSNLARFDGVHCGHRAANPDDVIDLYSASREEGFGREVKRRIMLGTYALSSGYYDAYYLRALKVRTLLRQDFEKAFEEVDAIVSPVAPTTAFEIGEKTQDPLAMYLADIYTISVNLAGIPAVSLPCGFDSRGLPIGMQLMGPVFAEPKLLNIAHRYQSLTDFHTRGVE